MEKVLLALASFKDLPYLKEVLPGLEQLRQELPADLVILNNAKDPEIHEFLRANYPQAEVIEHEKYNVGFGCAYNEMLRRFPGHEYLLLTTSDVLFDVPSVKLLFQRMKEDPELTACAGKLHVWDTAAKRKTKIIDSLGLALERRHRFFDRGAGEEDHGQYDAVLNEVFGLSGATFFLRLSVLPKLHGSDWQLFDERMWMYKEDADLSYRLRWLGEKIAIFPEVWAWHARTVAGPRGNGVFPLLRADQVKRDYSRYYSYRNHWLLLKNNFSFAFGWQVLVRVFWFELLKGAYLFFRHPSVFWAGMKALFFGEKRSSARRVPPSEVARFFQ